MVVFNSRYCGLSEFFPGMKCSGADLGTLNAGLQKRPALYHIRACYTALQPRGNVTSSSARNNHKTWGVAFHTSTKCCVICSAKQKLRS